MNPAPPDFLLLLGFLLLTYVSDSLPVNRQILYHIKHVKERKNRLKNAKKSQWTNHDTSEIIPFATDHNGPAEGREETAHSHQDKSVSGGASDLSFPNAGSRRLRGMAM